MFKLDINYLDNLIKTSQISGNFEDPLKKVTEIGLASSCTIFVFHGKNRWSGSGFHLGEGLIVTAGHVVPPDINISEIKISFDSKNYFNAELIVSEPGFDVGLLRCEQIKNIPALKLGNSDSLEIGDMVAVVSAPEGFHDTVTYGRISNVHQSVENVESSAWKDILFIDADILEGSSGGMVLGTDGLVYGIVIGVTGHHAELGIGHNSVSPSNKIKSLLQSIQ